MPLQLPQQPSARSLVRLPPLQGCAPHHRLTSLLPRRRCTLINSPLATNVTGQMKDILTTALGMSLFDGMEQPLLCCSAASPHSSLQTARAHRPHPAPHPHQSLCADVKYSPMNIAGIGLGLVGSITYSAVSYSESRAAAARASKARASPPNSLLPQRHHPREPTPPAGRGTGAGGGGGAGAGAFSGTAFMSTGALGLSPRKSAVTSVVIEGAG